VPRTASDGHRPLHKRWRRRIGNRVRHIPRTFNQVGLSRERETAALCSFHQQPAVVVAGTTPATFYYRDHADGIDRRVASRSQPAQLSSARPAPIPDRDPIKDSVLLRELSDRRTSTIYDPEPWTARNGMRLCDREIPGKGSMTPTGEAGKRGVWLSGGWSKMDICTAVGLDRVQAPTETSSAFSWNNKIGRAASDDADRQL